MPTIFKKPSIIPEMKNFDDVRQAIASAVDRLQNQITQQIPSTDMKGKRITNVGTPIGADDAVTLRYLQVSSAPTPTGSTNITNNITSSPLWVQVGHFLYPVQFATWAVIVGDTQSDFFNLPGQICATINVGVMSSRANASVLVMGTSPGARVFLQSTKSGTGTVLPIGFAIGATFTVIMDTNGALLCNFLSYDGSAAGRIIGSSWVGSSSAGSNSHVIYLNAIIGGTTETTLVSDATGSASQLHLSVYIGATRHSTFRTDGNFIVSFLSSDAFSTGPGAIVGSAVAGMGLVTAATNADVFKFQIASNICEIISTHTGTGTTRPTAFFFDTTEVARFNTFGTLLLGLTTTDVGVNSAGNIVSNNGFFAIVTATTNASLLAFSVSAGTSVNISSNKTGTGAVLPIAFGLPLEVARFTTGGIFLAGITSTDLVASSGAIVSSVGLFVLTAATNASAIFLSITAGTTTNLTSGRTGTGTFLPMAFIAQGVEAMRITSTGSAVLVKRTTDDGTGATLQVSGNISVNGTILTVP